MRLADVRSVENYGFINAVNAIATHRQEIAACSCELSLHNPYIITNEQFDQIDLLVTPSERSKMRNNDEQFVLFLLFMAAMNDELPLVDADETTGEEE